MVYFLYSTDPWYDLPMTIQINITIKFRGKSVRHRKAVTIVRPSTKTYLFDPSKLKEFYTVKYKHKQSDVAKKWNKRLGIRK